MKFSDCRLEPVDRARAAQKPGPWASGERLWFATHATFTDDKPHKVAVRDEARDRWIGVQNVDPAHSDGSLLIELEKLTEPGNYTLRLIVDGKRTDHVVEAKVNAPTQYRARASVSRLSGGHVRFLPEAEARLNEFLETSNYSSGSIDEPDRQKFRAFIIQAHRDRSMPIDDTAVSDRVRERWGARLDELATRLGSDYFEGRNDPHGVRPGVAHHLLRRPNAGLLA